MRPCRHTSFNFLELLAQIYVHKTTAYGLKILKHGDYVLPSIIGKHQNYRYQHIVETVLEIKQNP
ncbi:hypothetical protein SOMG_03882 [Schizosaccharomyces osmophilus]|uniref:Uncharacterized protein n=1 Tax=Schizosaccharomyces osmophilus TaxID=2545709 RepID=A0AAF0AW94_9SCHI|nr:uncharacterized protein SOMG_03882 [Schizosaccharomyces osmophilus]WBW73293.1 hypothetical protein SOMG_03882 [Schizosaccharomyces osmophilus]